MLRIFEKKIFPVPKTTFVQYLMLYISSLGPASKVFTQKFLTFFILKSMNCLQKEHLSVRQQAMNFLASFMAYTSDKVLPTDTLHKSLELLNRFIQKNKLADINDS